MGETWACLYVEREEQVAKKCKGGPMGPRREDRLGLPTTDPMSLPPGSVFQFFKHFKLFLIY